MNLEIQKIKYLAETWYRKHDNDAGWDIPLPNDDTIFPMATKVIPLGWAVAIPDNYVGFLMGRSSTFIKKDLQVVTGVIDSGYRGEIGLVLHNVSNEPVYVHKGERLCQLLVVPCEHVDLSLKDSLDNTIRSCNGFGSTGK